MRYRIFILAALAALAAHAVQMASQPWVTNRIAEAVAAIPAPDFTTNNAALVETIQAKAPAPDLTPATNYTDAATNDVLQEAKGYASGLLEGDIYPQNVYSGNSISGQSIGTATAQFGQLEINGDEWGGSSGNLIVNGTNVMDAIAANATGISASVVAARAYTDAAVASAVPAGVVVTNEGGQIEANLSTWGDISAGGSLQAYNGTFYGLLTVNGTNVTDAIAERALATDISTNNPAFVNAVTNCPVVLADMGSGDFGDFGTYGTLGALLAALAAAVVALRTGKMDKYPFAAATVESGVLALQDATIQTWTPGSGTSVAIAAPTGTSATARDMELVIDCSSLTEGDEPTVTWPAAFHPRTDVATDFACAAGVRNVYYISEYASGEFAVGGWQETAGGNA